MNKFETPTWVKREGCRLYLGYFGMERLVDQVPDEKIDALVEALGDMYRNIEPSDDEIGTLDE